jgi:hypothetical protein
METMKELLTLISLVFEYHGQSASEERLTMFAEDLKAFSLNEIKSAWQVYRLKNTKLPLPKDLIEHMQDGRPPTQEAWSMIPKNESDSVVWTDEMRLAYGVCAPLINQGQITNAFFAFKETYERLVMENRLKKVQTNASPSFGFDKTGRETAIKKALEMNMITYNQAKNLFPEGNFTNALPQLEHTKNASNYKNVLSNLSNQKQLPG